ncbi:MAG: outer-membrane lipoprotein carrier protein LolA [Parvularculaceae bacterium]|nr:outer-membrane lipoprotein carrier protein LolA [Parvularculaceae bacterium]
MIAALFMSTALFCAEVSFAVASPVVAAPPATPTILAQADERAAEKAADIPVARPASSLAYADLSDEAVADAALKAIENLTTLSAKFRQTAPSGAVVMGDVKLRRPGQVRFDYDDPSPVTIVATGGVVYVENADLETTDSYPLGKTPLKFLLSKRVEIGDARLAGVERYEDAVAVTWESTDEETEGSLTLYLSAPDMTVSQWAVADAGGGVTVVELVDAKLGEKLDNRLFRAPDAGGAFIRN